jgi:hypothetical protein
VQADSRVIDNAFHPKESAMKNLPLAVRLIAAATSVTMTLLLLGTVVSIAEPQRSILIAKVQHSEQLPSAPVALAMASNGAAPASK